MLCRVNGIVLAMIVAVAAGVEAAPQASFAGGACEVAALRIAPGKIDRADLLDRNTGARLRIEPIGADGARLDLTAGPLSVRKLAWARGDFDVAIRAGADGIEMSRRQDRLRVARAGRAVEIEVGQPDAADLAAMRQLLADSDAVRQFRALRGLIAPGLLRHRAGAGVAVLDAWLGALAGEYVTSAPTMTSLAAEDGAGAADENEVAGPSCWEAYVTETTAAWDDYIACINQFAWYNPIRELCAFQWVLRAESAWFQFLGCSSIPIKKEPADDSTAIPRH